jgi:N-terminal half of MaoC dehydratase
VLPFLSGSWLSGSWLSGSGPSGGRRRDATISVALDDGPLPCGAPATGAGDRGRRPGRTVSERGKTVTDTSAPGTGAADGLESIIGRSTGTSVVTIERGPVSFFADSLFDASPVYHRTDAAREAGFTDIPVPPTYLIAMAHWGSFPELQPAGAVTESMMSAVAPFLAPGGLILHGEQEFEYRRPVVVGDVLVGEGAIVNAYRKESRGATMTFVVVETRWSERESGEPVATSTFNMIYRV